MTRLSEERDYDVIVVGTGVAGHCAALEALDAGARVLMMDSEGETGGSSRHSTGMLMGANTRYQRERGILDDSAARLHQSYMMSNQWSVQPSVARRLCYECGPTVDWLESRGVELLDVVGSSGEDRPRSHITRGGAAIIGALAGHVGRYDRVDTIFKTRVDRLLMRDGAAVGVAADDEKVMAGAIVLATGGLGADLDMLSQWHPEAFWEGWSAPSYVGPASARGDGLRIAQQVDAQVVRSRGSRSPMWSFGGGYPPGYLIIVNALGRRFYDETSGYGVAELMFSGQPGGRGFALFDDAVKREMVSADDVAAHVSLIIPETMPQYGLFTSTGIDELVKSGQVKKADSLELLARNFGVPEENLLGSVERYNEHVARGCDDDYLKPAKSLRPISTGPFYGFGVELYLFGLTGAGIRIDHQASVIHRTSRSIPGLFAAGECTGGVLGSVYIGSGNALASASTYGRIAGRNAAAYASEGKVPPVDWKAIDSDAA
ncbi:MAG: FAD-binding protein [Deltaproteobacteria bacterium]|nr:FAD-binding protein [Deltaproteobacteria bacterium]